MLGWVISGWSVLIGELLRISGSKNWTFFPFSVQASRCLRWKQFTRVKRENMQHLSSYIDTRWTKIFQWPFIQTLNSKERRWSHAYFFVRNFFLSMKNTKKGDLIVDNKWMQWLLLLEVDWLVWIWLLLCLCKSYLI